MFMKLICVYGAVNDKIEDKFKEAAFELGKKIAEKNYGLIYSGMKGGVSGAVAKGAATENASKIIGIMPKFFKKLKNNDMFPGCTKKIFTKDFIERKKLMNNKADIILVAPGGVGTIDELFNAICTKRWGMMNKPIIIYNLYNYYENLIEMLENSIKLNFGKENYRETYKIINNLDDIFKYLENLSVNK